MTKLRWTMLAGLILGGVLSACGLGWQVILFSLGLVIIMEVIADIGQMLGYWS